MCIIIVFFIFLMSLYAISMLYKQVNNYNIYFIIQIEEVQASLAGNVANNGSQLLQSSDKL